MKNTIEIFGREIPVRTHYCSMFGQEPSPVDEIGITLYVRTKFCNAKCSFCTFANTAEKFNREKYVEVLKELTGKSKIKKIAFTGGEPTLYWDQFKWMVEKAKDMSPDSIITMNTDGLRLTRLFEDPISKLFNNIHISRHHWDDQTNNEIFKTKTPTDEELKYVQTLTDDKGQIQLSCNLIKGYVDDKDKMFHFLEWTNGLEINNVGFVSLMPVNKYSMDNFITFNMRDLVNERFNVSKEWQYKNSCQCTNYVYIPEDVRRPIRVYHKNTFAPFDIQETVVFDGENVKLGFEGEIIA